MRIVSDVATSRDIIQVVGDVTGKDLSLKEIDRKAFESARPVSEELWSKLSVVPYFSSLSEY